MDVGKYTLQNPDKIHRAIHGTVLSQGQLKGGVGEDAEPAAILAEYDRLGGLILMDGKYKVKTGSFYDFAGRKSFAKPKPTLLFTINGEVIEVPADKPLPLEVQAAEQADTRKKERATKKGKGKDKKNKDADEEDEDGELA